MIKSLTPEQIAHEDVVCEKWIKIAFRTESITEAEAAKATESLYKMLGEKAPPFEIHPGPVAAWKRVCELATDDPAKRAELERNIVLPLIDGAINAGYYAYLEFLDYIGVPVGKIPEVQLYRDLANVSWVWPLEDLCIFCDFPKQINRDADGNLHNETGPSVEYRDGVKMWDLNGIQCDEQIIMAPQTQTIDQMVKDTNADRQAIRIDRFGWLRFLKETNAETLDERDNLVEGTYETLYSTNIGNRKAHCLVATCVTGKIPVMPVPTNIDSCVAAQEWIHNNRKLNIIGRT